MRKIFLLSICFGLILSFKRSFAAEIPLVCHFTYPEQVAYEGPAGAQINFQTWYGPSLVIRYDGFLRHSMPGEINPVSVGIVLNGKFKRYFPLISGRSFEAARIPILHIVEHHSHFVGILEVFFINIHGVYDSNYGQNYSFKVKPPFC